MTTIKPGDKAPDFESINQDGNKIKLSDFNNKKLVLFFYQHSNYIHFHHAISCS